MSEDIHQDRAFQYGDGMFTTMHVACGRVALWSLHKQRLQNDCARLGLTLDLASLTEQVHAAAEKLADGVLKVHISSGCGGRGYQRPAGQSAVWRLSDFSVPAQYACWQKQGIAADISPVTLGLQPLLAGIKHINRLEQVLVKEQITLDDAIVCDMQGYVTEASASNVFWYADGQCHTYTVSILISNRQTGISKNLLTRGNAELDKPVHLFCFFLFDVILRVEIIDLTGKTSGIVTAIE